LGHPWVYSRAIQQIEGPKPGIGDLVDVADAGGQHLGVGVFNPNARIAVRMLDSGVLDSELAEWIRVRVQAARTLRQQMLLPNEDTDAFRLINSDGDGLPGVVCDQLGPLAAVQITSAAAEQWLPLLMDALGHEIIHVTVPEDAAKMEGIAPGHRLGRGDYEEHVTFRENGIQWNLKPGKGQKTGFYTDQRENRRLIRSLAEGKSVLDCYCYTGGFSLNAAKGGATRVVGVDSSGPAVSVASGTAEINGIDCTRFVKEDVLRYLKALGDETFDCVILDPPKLVRHRAHLEQGVRKYTAINSEGMRHVAPGGFLVTCSCSGLVDNTQFMRMLTEAAHRAGRRLTMVEIRGPGADHVVPMALEEARYLSVVVCRVD